MVKPSARNLASLLLLCAAGIAPARILSQEFLDSTPPGAQDAAGAGGSPALQAPEDDPPPAPEPPQDQPPQEDAPASSPVVGEEQPPTTEPSPEVESAAPLPEVQLPPPKPRKARRKQAATLQEKHDELLRRIEALAPRGTYLMIDTGTNRLYLMRNRCILRAAICSTGSGRFLDDPPRKRDWTFETPKGEFRIRRKVENPVWIKPDWAFIEEGEPIPKNQSERRAPEELGDYAMDLGDGYLIHGTLYERSLGMSVTHGCVRLGAKDLEAIFKTVRIGTPVYIF